MFSCIVGREEHCKQISLTYVRSAHSVWTTLGLPQLTAAHAFQVYNAQATGCSAGVLSKVGPVFRALPRSKLLRFRHLGTPSSKAQTRLGLHFVPFPGPSSSGDQVFGKHSCCDLLLPPSLPLSFLGVQPEHLLRWMLTVQSPKKS